MIRKEMAHHYKGNWSRISKWVRETVGHCVACGNRPVNKNCLTVHHIDFNPANNELSNLVCLCARCHLRKHGLIRRYGRDTDAQLEIPYACIKPR